MATPHIEFDFSIQIYQCKDGSWVLNIKIPAYGKVVREFFMSKINSEESAKRYAIAFIKDELRMGK